jgi:hypothetical protein
MRLEANHTYVSCEGEILGYGCDCPYCDGTSKLMYNQVRSLELRDADRCQHLFGVDATKMPTARPMFVFVNQAMT